MTSSLIKNSNIRWSWMHAISAMDRWTFSNFKLTDAKKIYILRKGRFTSNSATFFMFLSLISMQIIEKKSMIWVSHYYSMLQILKFKPQFSQWKTECMEYSHVWQKREMKSTCHGRDAQVLEDKTSWRNISNCLHRTRPCFQIHMVALLHLCLKPLTTLLRVP